MAAYGSVAMRVVSRLDVQAPAVHLQSRGVAVETDQLPAGWGPRRPSEVRSKFASDRC